MTEERRRGWMCSCGTAAFCWSDGQWKIQSRQRKDHLRENPDHWEIHEHAWDALPCGHCPCFKGERDASVICCKCQQPYGPLVTIGGRRFLAGDLAEYVKDLSLDSSPEAT